LDRDKFLDKVLQDELKRLNTHLPKNRKTIQELLREDSPSVTTLGGGKLALKKDELETFSQELPEDLRNRIKLPIVLLRRRELGPGAFTLLGDPHEEYAISKILGDEVRSFAEFQSSKTPTVFYKPQVSGLLRRFHSLVTVGFGLTE